MTGSCPVGSYVRAIAADGTVTCQADGTGPANAFVQGGNAFGATAALGTTDNNALEIAVNGARVMRFEPSGISPNVIGGMPATARPRRRPSARRSPAAAVRQRVLGPGRRYR